MPYLFFRIWGIRYFLYAFIPTTWKIIAVPIRKLSTAVSGSLGCPALLPPGLVFIPGDFYGFYTAQAGIQDAS